LFLFIFWQILDLVPALSHLYFQEKIPVTLSHAQACVLLCTGLQNQDISHIEVCSLTCNIFCWNNTILWLSSSFVQPSDEEQPNADYHYLINLAENFILILLKFVYYIGQFIMITNCLLNQRITLKFIAWYYKRFE
jgi:hypothetical protein